MIYRRDNNQEKKKKFFVILAIFFFLYLFTLTPIGGFTRAQLARIAPSIWGVGEQLALSNVRIFSVFDSKSALIEENETLKKEIRDISLKLLDRNLLYEENLLLKERLGRGEYGQAVVARVISKPPRSLYDTLVVDPGSREGIQVGKRGVPALAVGIGGGNFEIQIPRDTLISLGDSILAPSIMPHFLGVVEYIESKESDPFERILFKSPISPLEIETVDIVVE